MKSDEMMKKIKVGLNGFGRIGRALTRINLTSNLFELVVINDINPDPNNMAYLLQYDSTYGSLPEKVSIDENYMCVENNRYRLYHKTKVEEVPWGEHDVEVVIDASGINIREEVELPLRSQGVNHYVRTSTPNGIPSFKYIVMGVNEDEISKSDFFISSSICDTNALLPILSLLEREYGVISGFLTTLHPWLNYQNLLDGPSTSVSDPRHIHSTYVLGRASLNALIPKTTTALKAAEPIFPWVTERLMSLSYRVPTSIVCSADLSLVLSKSVSRDDLIKLFEDAQDNQRWKVICNSSEPLTSVDYMKSPYSVIIDNRWTDVNVGGQVKLLTWYDNEWGYSSRVVDLITYLAEL